MSDFFWKPARQQTVREATLTIDAAGFEVSPVSVLELINSAPLVLSEIDYPRFTEGYLFACLQQIQRRLDAGQVQQKDLDRSVDFWLRDFPLLADNTQSCILFDIRSRLQPIASLGREDDLFDQVFPPELRGWEDRDYL